MLPRTATPSGLCFLGRSSRLLVSDAVFPLSGTAVHAFVFLSVASDFGGFGGRETIAARSVRCLDGKAQGCLLPWAPGAGPASVRACRARPAAAGRLPALPCTSSGLPSRPSPTLPQCSPGVSGPAPVPLLVPLSPLQCGQLCPDEKMACRFDECGFPPPEFLRKSPGQAEVSTATSLPFSVDLARARPCLSDVRLLSDGLSLGMSPSDAVSGLRRAPGRAWPGRAPRNEERFRNSALLAQSSASDHFLSGLCRRGPGRGGRKASAWKPSPW